MAGMDVSKMTSPPLSWVNAPKGTQSFVLLLHDPDAHARKAFEDITHWMIFNIPGDSTSLPEGVKPDSSAGVQAANVTGQPIFFGPCAPPGPPHHYTFELFALDTKLDLAKGASRADVQKAMDGHVLTGTVLIGLFVPWDLVRMSLIPAVSMTARMAPPEITPVPGAAGLSMIRAAPHLR